MSQKILEKIHTISSDYINHNPQPELKKNTTTKTQNSPYDSEFKKSIKKYYTKKVIRTINELSDSPIDLMVISIGIPPTFDHLSFYSFWGIEQVINKFFDFKDSSLARELKESHLFLVPNIVSNEFYKYPELRLNMVILSNSLCPYSKFLIENRLISKTFYMNINHGNYFHYNLSKRSSVWSVFNFLSDFEKSPNLDPFVSVNNDMLNLKELRMIPFIPVLEVDIHDYGSKKLLSVPRFTDYMEILS